MKCDVCGNGVGVSIVHGVLAEAESAGVRRLCAPCNTRAASFVKRLGLFTEGDRLADDRRRKFVEYLRREKAQRKQK